MHKKNKPERLGLYIPKDVHQRGDVSIEGSIRIDGSFSGNLYCDATLHISKTGSFIGEADVAEAEISGKFQGNLRVRSRFSLSKTGSFSGLLDANLASIEAGSHVEGEVRITGILP